MFALPRKLLFTATPVYMLASRILRIDVTQEKQEKRHDKLIHDVEAFSATKLKHADTLEKVILPNAEGTSSVAKNLVHAETP